MMMREYEQAHNRKNFGSGTYNSISKVQQSACHRKLKTEISGNSLFI